MARIDRKQQQIFGSNAGATGITEYGSPAAGSAEFSTDLDEIQTAAFLTGWSAAALAGSEIPTFQDFNAIHYVATSQLAYLFQEGLAEWETGTTYYTNSIVKKAGTYELYGSLINDNQGNALPNQVADANWTYLGDLSSLAAGSSPLTTKGDVYTYSTDDERLPVGANGQVLRVNSATPTGLEWGSSGQDLFHIRDERASGTDGGTATSGSYQTRVLNTVKTNEISGASLSSNQITLPAGTYYVEWSAPCHADGAVVSRNKSRLQSVSGSSVSILGSSEFTEAGGSEPVTTRSFGSGRFTIAGNSTIELQHRVEVSNSGDGFGQACSFGDIEVYSDIRIWRV